MNTKFDLNQLRLKEEDVKHVTHEGIVSNIGKAFKKMKIVI